MNQDNTTGLRRALAANAAFSTVTGTTMVLAPDTVAGWLGIGVGWPILWTGASLLPFAAFVAWQARRERVDPGLAVATSVADLGWVAGSAALLAGWGSAFSSQGVALVIGVAAVVGLFAVAQLSGIKTMMREPDATLGTDWRHSVVVDVDVAADRMWTVVGNLADVKRFSTQLASVTLDRSVSEAGAVRSCADHAGQRWTETCRRYDSASRAFDVEFDAEAPDFPFPMTAMWGGWRVVPAGSGSRVEVWFSVTPRAPFAGWLVAALMGASVDRSFSAMVHRMADAAREPSGDVRPVLTS